MRALFCSLLVCMALLGFETSRYEGAWASDGGANSGKVSVSLSGTGEGDLTFTYQDQLIKPKKVTAKISGDQVEFVCELDLEGFKLKTTFRGAMEGKNISGKYQTLNVEDGSPLDSGTWKVTQK